MTIEIRGSGGDATLETHIRNRLTPLLERWRMTAAGAQVGFVDENGPKGGVALRCALTLRLPRRPPLHVDHLAETPLETKGPSDPQTLAISVHIPYNTKSWTG